MSGTSLDGLDFALCRFDRSNEKFKYEILKTGFFEYSEDLKKRLAQAHNLPAYELSPIRSSHCMVYYAYRYGLDYSGLRRALPLPAERQPAPGTAKPAEVKKKEEKAEEAFLARVHDLGY